MGLGLAPSLAVEVFAAHSTEELAEAAPIEAALAAPVEFVVGVDPTAAASFGFAVVPVVVVMQHARHELYGHCEGAARYTTRQVSPMQ